jgi:hypothetical protein
VSTGTHRAAAPDNTIEMTGEEAGLLLRAG